jgi:polysaccharide pyruvyl transferase WcaK-like protein
MTKQRVLIVGAAGFTNLGDDAILAAMLAELRDALPDAALRVTLGDPDRWSGAADVAPLPFDDRAIEAELARADLLIIGGGGFIYDYDRRVATHDFLHGDARGFYPYYRAAFAARTRGVPVYFYAIGVGPLLTAAGRALTREVLSTAAAITVRDPLSLLELHAAGLTVPAPQVTADPAVRLPPATEPWSGPGGWQGRAVGFVARAWLQLGGAWTAGGAEHFERYVAWLAAAADYVVERWGATPLFIPLQRRYDDDRAVEERIIARMRHPARARLLDGVADYRALQALLGRLDAVVSTRLHPLILATVADVPTIGIALAPKVRAYLASLGLAEFALSPWRAGTADLTAALDRALAEPEPLRARLRTGLAGQARAASRNPAVAAALLGRPAPSEHW